MELNPPPRSSLQFSPKWSAPGQMGWGSNLYARRPELHKACGALTLTEWRTKRRLRNSCAGCNQHLSITNHISWPSHCCECLSTLSKKGRKNCARISGPSVGPSVAHTFGNNLSQVFFLTGG